MQVQCQRQLRPSKNVCATNAGCHSQVLLVNTLLENTKVSSDHKAQDQEISLMMACTFFSWGKRETVIYCMQVEYLR
jgi:hypothetical protein